MSETGRTELSPAAQGAIFAAIALTLSWLPATFVGDDEGSPITLAATLIRLTSPLLAAIVLRKFITREGFAGSGHGLRGTWPAAWGLAVVLPLAWGGLALGVNLALGTVSIRSVDLAAGSLVWGLVTTLAWVAPEEVGWRGTLLPKLRPLGLHPALLAIGVVWFAWHPEMILGEKAWAVKLLYLVDVILLSYATGWLYLRGGSVWPCVLMHATHNFMYDPITTETIPAHALAEEAVYTCAIAVVVAALWLLGKNPVRPSLEN